MKYRGQLLPGERVILMTRSHPVILLPATGLFFCVIVISSFSATLMPSNPILAYLSLIPALWLLFLGIRHFWRWFGRLYILTNYKIVIRRGILGASYREISLGTVEAVDVGKVAFSWGRQANLKVYSLHGADFFPRIPQANTVSELIYRAQQGQHGRIF